MSTQAPELTGLAHAYLLDGRGGCEHLDWNGVTRWTAADGALWLNLDYTVADVQHWLAERSAIDPLIRDALLDDDPRPRAAAHGDALLLIVRAINLNEGAAPEDMLSIRAWVEPHRMVTLRHRHSRSIKAIAAEFDHGCSARLRVQPAWRQRRRRAAPARGLGVLGAVRRVRGDRRRADLAVPPPRLVLIRHRMG